MLIAHDHVIRAILDNTPVGMLLVNTDGRIIFVNGRACAMLGWRSEDDLIGQHINCLIPPRYHQDHEVSRQHYQKHERISRPMGGNRDLLALRCDGSELPVEIGLSTLTLEGELYTLVSMVDVSDRFRARDLQEVNDNLAYMATHDPLTHLPNRKRLLNLLDEALATPEPLVLAFVDLDGFKPVNDTFGHVFGDRVLQEVAELLHRNIRKTDVLGRLGGDEFLVIFYGSEYEQAIARVLENIRQAVADLNRVEAEHIQLTVSIGAVTRPRDVSISSEDLIARADALMYQAKRDGRNRVVSGAI
ncbi:MAG TPA: sensor domain-containing diguanylate cyclase [Cellvibrionaceae bacterium]